MVFRFRPRQSACGLMLVAAAAVCSIQPGQADEHNIKVLVDQASVLRLERPAAEIIVGNPSIADVAVQNSKTIVLTGKSYGETNLIVLDSSGKSLINRQVVVQEPRGGYVTVYRGTQRETLHCAPNCETPLVVGDAPDYFEALAKEIRTKQAISQASAEGENQAD